MANNDTVLAIYPNSFGFGYAVCDSQDTDGLRFYGQTGIKPLLPNKYVARIKQYINKYKPDIILLRGYEYDPRISKRIIKVIQEFEILAKAKNIPIHFYDRSQVQIAFSSLDSQKKKYSIARKIVEYYPELKCKLPEPRTITKAEHWNMGIFDAMAILVTFFVLRE